MSPSLVPLRLGAVRSAEGPPSAQALSCRGAAHSPPRISTFLRVSSVMYGLIRLKATGKSLGAETGTVSGFPGVFFPCLVASVSPALSPTPIYAYAELVHSPFTTIKFFKISG